MPLDPVCNSFWVSGNQGMLTLFSRNLCICHHLHCALFLLNSGLGTEFSMLQVSSVAQLSLTLCDPMDCSTPGFPVHHQLPELGQTHAIESVKPFNHLVLCCPCSCLQSLPASGSFLMSQFFAAGGQHIGGYSPKRLTS